MNLLAINASHRGDKGQTHLFVDHLFRGARAAGADCEEVFLARLKINRCLSCYECQVGKNHLSCVYNDKDDARLVFEKMAAADLVIYATPIYVMNMTGLMKTFLDRLYSTMDVMDARLSGGLIHHHVNRELVSKPFVPLIVLGNLEDVMWRSVTYYFRVYGRLFEAPQVGLLVRNGSSLFDPGNSDLVQMFPKTLEALAAYEQAGLELATLGRIRRATQSRANQEVVPLPFFRWLKLLRPVKQKVIDYMRKASIH